MEYTLGGDIYGLLAMILIGIVAPLLVGGYLLFTGKCECSKISSNEMKDKNGRLIKTGTNTQFYLYAVCDITSKLRKIAEDFDFIETPDKRGMYKYHDKKRAYIEILSFDKIIDDAGKRNRILFEKLGI